MTPYDAEGTTAGEAIRQKEPTQVSATSLKDNFDTVEIRDSALKRFQRTQFQYADPEMKQTER